MIPLFLIPFTVISICYAVIIGTIFSRQMPGEHKMQKLKGDGKPDASCEDEKMKMESNKKKREMKQVSSKNPLSTLILPRDIVLIQKVLRFTWFTPKKVP